MSDVGDQRMRHRNGNTERLSEKVFQEREVFSLLELWIRASKGERCDLWMGLPAVAMSCTLP